MFRLPDGWSPPEVVEDFITIDRLTIHRAGVSTVGPDGGEVCGSAADAAGSARERAWYELLERVSALEMSRRPAARLAVMDEDAAQIDAWAYEEVFPESDDPARWRYSISNGVALHESWASACRRAFWELAERDRVLHTWLGSLVPASVDVDLASTPLGRVRTNEWRVCRFRDDSPGFSRGVEVAGVFGFPRDDAAPFVLGFAGRPTLREAVDAAMAEALQMMAFLWGEPFPEEVPANAGPAQHLDRYQVRGAWEIVRAWLDGAHVRYAQPRPPRRAERVGFVDLTPPWLEGGLRVAKAVCREAAPLVFGESPLVRHLPPELRIHPIA